MDINLILAKEFGLADWQVNNTVALIDEGNTIPFIARYRKEMHGTLSDEVLRKLDDRLNYLKNLENKKETVLKSIKEQDKLTKEIEKAIKQGTTLVEIEDIYRPYKQKKRTRATIAKEKGLEELADIILQQKEDNILELAEKFIDAEKEVLNVEDAIKGAKDIIAEKISDEAEYRKYLRKKIFENDSIITKVKDTEAKVYEMYFDYIEKIKNVKGHRILAINRAEKEKAIVVKIETEDEIYIRYLENKIIIDDKFNGYDILKATIEDSYKRLILPAIEREIRATLTEKAGEGAIEVFGKNISQLLLQPPIINKRILALDPAFRTGCKVAVIDENGKVLDTDVIYPTPPHNKIKEAEAKLLELINKHKVNLVSIGNGTASRETEKFTADLIKNNNLKLQYIIVNEAGASVYSASKLGTKEFPDFDVALRSAVSIGRRLQDPLAELVKIDPKSIGVGQYQHDMNQKRLSETLKGVVEDCVNKVGIDLNTASPSLLNYVSGITATTASNIVKYRETEGEFKSRKEILKVSKLGPKAFEQCAGFLRIRDAKDPLDNTGVHPESYKIAKELLKRIDLKSGYTPLQLRVAVSKVGAFSVLCEELGVGEPTLRDIMKELEKPGRDPRSSMPAPVLRSDVLEMKDLKQGMVLKGTVRNIIDFGAFVDIGVHQDGLVHISRISKDYIKHPLEAVSIGDIVDVQVIDVNIAKGRISLSMIIE